VKPPLWLWVLLALIFAVVVVGVADKLLCWHRGWFEAAGLVVLGATLAAVVVYVFFTARIAEEAWSASASLVLQQDPGDMIVNVVVKNHGRLALTAWCRLNATVNGQAVPSTGFYAGASPMRLQPLGEIWGRFDLRDIASAAGTTLPALQAVNAPANTKTQMRFDVEFWYAADATGREYRNPRQPYYVDTRPPQLVTDF
jgi:hypothetical protein